MERPLIIGMRRQTFSASDRHKTLIRIVKADDKLVALL